MAGGYYYLTEEQVKLLQWAIDDARRRQVNNSAPSADTVDNFPSIPETYIALTPSTGIPALSQAAGTGSTPEGTADIPGSALCQVYQISGNTLNQLPSGMTKTVYNAIPAAIPQFTWVFIIKDKFGKWWAMPTAPAIKIGKCTTFITQGQIGVVALWDISPTAGGVVNSWSDLVHTGLDQPALFLLGPGVMGAWVILISWQYGYLAINIECNPLGTGT